MDDSKTYMNVQLAKPDSPSPSGDESDVSSVGSYFKTLSDSRVRTNEDGLPSIYSVLKPPKDELRIDDDEDPPTASGPAELPVAAQAAAQELEPKENIGSRPYPLICLLCLVTFFLVATVIGPSIHVSQIRQSKITSDRNCHELNSTLQSKLSELNWNLSDLKRMHSDLRHQFTEMETMYRSVNETKAQICKLLTSSREKTCSADLITNKDRCYYVSIFETSLYNAIQECSSRDSRLLEINSRDEASFVTRKLLDRNRSYWIGKCEDRNVSFRLLYKESSGTTVCNQCDPTAVTRRYPCDRDQRFICEKPAPLIPDIPEKIQDLCLQPVEAT